MFHIDYKSGLPIYEQLYRSVVSMISSGALGAGQALPSVRAVAQQLGVNPNTVQKGFALLEKDGVIYSLPGKGSFVADTEGAVQKRREQALEKLREALHEALDSGVTQKEIMVVMGGGKHD